MLSFWSVFLLGLVCLFVCFSLLNNHKIIPSKPAEEKELDKWPDFRKKTALKCSGAVLLHSAPAYSQSISSLL